MLKAIIKKILREDYWSFISWYRDRFGLIPSIVSYIYLIYNKGVGRAPNPLASGSVFLRPGTTDQNVYDEIFLDKEYGFDLGDPKFIVDAGAHIGLSSVFFASKYPKATVIAIEPELSNYNLLTRNAEGHDNISPVWAGLWSRKTHLTIQDLTAATWSFRVSENSSGRGIPAISISDIMSEYNCTHIDVLKLDIEGSEVVVLGQSQVWIDTVNILIIELHDRFQPGCEQALRDALSGHEYDMATSGESVVIKNITKIKS